MKLHGFICWNEVQHLCIRNRWYTCGDNEAFGKLQDDVRESYKVNLAEGSNAWYALSNWARDIKEHSETEYTADDIAGELLMHVCFTFQED